MKARSPKPFEILHRQFKILQRQNKAYSLRALARDLDLSPSFLSELLKGKRPVPMGRLKDIKRVLKMDDLAQASLDEALALEFLAKMPKMKKAIEQGTFRSSASEYAVLARKDLPLFAEWYNVAVMDLTTCANFVDDPMWIAGRLDITPAQAQRALAMLVREGFLVREDGVLRKGTKQVRMPTTHSVELIRGVHSQLIQKGLRNLLNQKSQADFDARLVNGVMFAANPENLARAKAKLTDALFEVAEILAEGPCTEVYQLNCQLFPLTKPAAGDGRGSGARE